MDEDENEEIDDGQDSEDSGGSSGVGKVKGGADKARRAGKKVAEVGKKIGEGAAKLFKAIAKHPHLALAILIIVLIVILIVIIWVAVEKEETQETSATVKEYTAGLSVESKFKTAYESSGSMLFASDADIKAISENYIKKIENKDAIKARAFQRKYFGGDISHNAANGVSSVNSIKSFYEHVLSTEKYNFNRINWQAYTRNNLNSGSEPSGKIDMQVDAETGLTYPKYLGESIGGSDLDFYANTLAPYLQSYIIPLAMTSGTTKGGTSGLTTEENKSFSADAYNARFGYEIIAQGYHKIDYTRYELYSRTITEEYKLYNETISTGKVTRTCTEYILAKDVNGNVVDPDSPDAVETKKSAPVCVDSQDIVYTAGTPKKIVEYPKNLKSNYYNIKKYVKENKEIEGITERTNSDGTLSFKDYGDTSTYQYDVTNYKGFDTQFTKSYTFQAYDITAAEMSANEESKKINNEKVYEGSVESGKEYVMKKDVAPDWVNTPGVVATNTQTKVTVTKEIQDGDLISVERTWTDELMPGESEAGDYTIEDIKDHAKTEKLSSYEERYYTRIQDEDRINIVDILNANKTMYAKYLKLGENESEYIGYTREYLQLSYYLLKQYLVELSDDYGLNFMWGDSIVPFSNSSLLGDGITGETLLISGANVIYPFTSDIIKAGNLKLQDSRAGNGSYGYAGHTGIDISYSYTAADKSKCSDYTGDNIRRCPYLKGPKVYTIMEGTLVDVTYSECNVYYHTGKCNDAAMASYINNPNRNPNLTIRTSSGAVSVIIQSSDGTKTVYYHMYPDYNFYNSLAGHVGETLPIGTLVGYMGNTGKSTGMHLHIENGPVLWQTNGTRTLALLKQGMNNTLGKNINNVSQSGNDTTISAEGLNESVILTDSTSRAKLNKEQLKSIINKSYSGQCRANMLSVLDDYVYIQDTYNVNAVMAIATCFIESTGGTNWATLTLATHNWCSLTWYKANSIGGAAAPSYRKKPGGTAWMTYTSFSQATRDFGQYISKKQVGELGHRTIEQIGPSYCGTGWMRDVKKEMNRLYSNLQK